MRDPGLARWIDDNVAFPSSMVDRITPKTSLEDRAMVARRFGIADEWPVVTEPFSQWIIEDDFSNARPPLDAVGARFVTDVRPYALAKTRLLNAGHSALGYLGSLAGHVRADEAVRDPVFAAYLERMMADEVAPLLPPVPGLDLDDYREQLMERFANPAIGDRLSRLCRNGSVKVPGHLLSSIRDARMTGRAHALLTLAVAAWCRYLRGVDDRGEAVAVEDPRAERLTRLARAGGTDPSALLTDRATFGDLGDDRAFAAALGRDLRALESRGARALVEARVAVGELVAA
jgi:fructuronate reductase/mannitol 2-dehydrogenase